MRRGSRLLLAAGAATAALTLLAPGVAHADGSQCSQPTGECAGKVAWQANGDLFRIWDQKADGRSAVLMYWLSDGSGPHTVRNSDGNGTRKDVDLELVEGDWIFYRACLSDAGVLVANSCSAGVTDYA